MKTDKNIRKYLRAVGRQLRLPKDLKMRVLADLEGSIRCRLEAGQSEEEIFRELGTPKQTAEELNRQMEEHAYRKSPWRWVCLVLAVICGMMILFNGAMGLLLKIISFPVHETVGVIGGADGPTAIFVTQPVESLIYGFLMNGVLMLMGIFGFFALGRIRKGK